MVWWILLSVLLIIASVVITTLKTQHDSLIETKIAEAAGSSTAYTPTQIEEYRTNNQFPYPLFLNKLLYGLAVLSLLAGSFNSIAFYAEPGFVYHIRTIGGTEKVARTVGWHTYWFGKYVPWKQNATIQARHSDDEDDNATASTSNQGPIGIMFLDQVGAKASAMARFQLPSDDENFIRLVHDYRSFDNLVNTVFTNSFRETINATASLMTAEEYFSGGRTTFASEFEVQMKAGIYMVTRTEETVALSRTSRKSANASSVGQMDNDENVKTIYVVKKLLTESGHPRIKKQAFLDYGITVSTARVTNMDPNNKFKQRMELKQQASADRAIAREKRVQEEEQRLLAIAKGEREVAEKQAEALVNQIEMTTNAETRKQMALTSSTQKKEAALIDKETAQITYERAQIDAKSIKVAADAEAHARKVKIQADNALKMKLDALVQMNADNAKALAQRAVPSTVVYGSGGSQSTQSGQLGMSDDIANIATTQMLKNLQALDVSVDISQ